MVYFIEVSKFVFDVVLDDAGLAYAGISQEHYF